MALHGTRGLPPVVLMTLMVAAECRDTYYGLPPRSVAPV